MRGEPPGILAYVRRLSVNASRPGRVYVPEPTLRTATGTSARRVCYFWREAVRAEAPAANGLKVNYMPLSMLLELVIIVSFVMWTLPLHGEGHQAEVCGGVGRSHANIYPNDYVQAGQ